ncbi:MAG TPA: hypothetical protein VF165_10875 [Nocardioidaceae bacterium]
MVHRVARPARHPLAAEQLEGISVSTRAGVARLDELVGPKH